MKSNTPDPDWSGLSGAGQLVGALALLGFGLATLYVFRQNGGSIRYGEMTLRVDPPSEDDDVP